MMSNVVRLDATVEKPREGKSAEGWPLEALLEQVNLADIDAGKSLSIGSWSASSGCYPDEPNPHDEVCFITEGVVVLTDLDSGESYSFGAGEAFFLRKGAHLRWCNDSYVEKFFVILA